MSFLLKLDDSRILRGIIETFASFSDESEFKVSSKDFEITSYDESMVSLIKFTMDKDKFDDYKCAKEHKISLNIDDLDKILKRSTIDDSIELEFQETDQKIKIKMKNKSSKRIRTFSLSVLGTTKEEVSIDKLQQIEYLATWAMTPPDFSPDLLVDAIKDAEIYSDILNIKVDENSGLTFNSSGQIGEMEYNIELDDLPEKKIKETEIGAYSISFLKKILKLASITEKLDIFLKTDYPLKMIFNILNGGILYYFLAPRVDKDEFQDDEDMDEFDEF
ncbi:MAG: proliferating cell nuclear antigen (pcna) [Candidatus Hodarchaeota archaeon]